jgi:hypothetical protein
MNAPIDTERARFNMIEQQIRPWDVLDLDVLDLLRPSGARTSCRSRTRPWPSRT